MHYIQDKSDCIKKLDNYFTTNKWGKILSIFKCKIRCDYEFTQKTFLTFLCMQLHCTIATMKIPDEGNITNHVFNII